MHEAYLWSPHTTSQTSGMREAWPTKFQAAPHPPSAGQCCVSAFWPRCFWTPPFRQVDHCWLGSAADDDPHYFFLRFVEYLVFGPCGNEGEIAWRHLVELRVWVVILRMSG